MKKVDEYTVVKTNGFEEYIDMNAVHGTMAMVLPYKKRHGHRQYLLEKKKIINWDPERDVCGIAVFEEEIKLEEALVDRLNAITAVSIAEDDLQFLGVCCADRHTNTFCKLYALDLSMHIDETIFIDESKQILLWSREEGIIKSVDAFLHAAYASLQYIFPESY